MVKERRHGADRYIFPVTKIMIKPKNKPSQRSDVVRLTFLEWPYRWYHGRTAPQQYFIKTAILSAILVFIPYNMAYWVSYQYAKPDILAKIDYQISPD